MRPPPADDYEGLSLHELDEIDRRVTAFEEAWGRGERPDLAGHLGGDPPAGPLLSELVHADLHFRLKSGEPARVEQYLARFPTLAGRPGLIASLLAVEYDFRQREEAGPLVLAEQRRRFPDRGAGSRQAADASQDQPLRPDTTVLLTGETDAGETDARLAESLRLLVRAPRAEGRPRIGRFAIGRVLGQGGFGVVYLATDLTLGRTVALKVPHPHALASPVLRARFLREARTAAALEHPNIVPVHEAGEAGPLCYLVTTYCPGEDLAAWLARRSEPVPPRTAAALVAALADAVRYSHDRGVLHRDLKPANVMLAPADAGGDSDLPFVPRLTDFGLAKLVEASLTETRTSVVLGTPLYMAPEQASGEGEAGPAADLYSLGVILYELLAGRTPFVGSLSAVFDQVRSADPPPLSEFRPGVPHDLETVCRKCLNKEPGDRYPSASELADDLRRFLDGDPIRARRLSRRQRLAYWACRPQRVRDAGVYAILLNLLILAWMTSNCVLAVLDRHSLATYQEHAGGLSQWGAVRDSLLIAVTTHVPLALVGWWTLRRSRRAVRVGTVLSAALVAVLFGAWTKLIPTFGGLYDDDRLRTTVFSILLLLFAAQLAGYLLAEAALRRNRAGA